ncbi:CRISPR-associated protein Cas1 [Thermoflavifilum aggregans]|uniref:CRISPR-associated endonuclease Cas1 n=1 Tax=Thermoflavifilum aggregans TaxID=454188 RepID=A0A2M9CYI4_9BACT|nr:type II CRISPR-associated endonuclease Cas1 [Thermoflavifilum aggregans]MBX6362077.1 type II CRISPR-associated endonuclease Cas1 [Pseudacidobacterium ailaaui]PJJ76798.1 CRISPR-associated protein Cas1 [Thermoflavifilum aggregans]
MIKRTLYFGNPAYLKTKNEQLIIEKQDTGEIISTPIEDIGILILDHQQITLTQYLLAKLLENNVAVITCDPTHHPAGLFYCLDGHTLQSQKHQRQIEASVPLKKQLWQQTVVAKIKNQAELLKQQRIENKYLLKLCDLVRSGDPDNCEAKAAIYYWKHLFPDFLQFTRDRNGPPPNNLLNYGYTILRALVARSLTASGLLPTLGIHHRNQYNNFCLADDIMEPYRPFVDAVVCHIVMMNGKFLDMTPSMKKQLLSIPAMDVKMEDQKSPLMNAVQRTTASLAKCFEGSSRKILYPTFC